MKLKMSSIIWNAGNRVANTTGILARLLTVAMTNDQANLVRRLAVKGRSNILYGALVYTLFYLFLILNIRNTITALKAYRFLNKKLMGKGYVIDYLRDVLNIPEVELTSNKVMDYTRDWLHHESEMLIKQEK